MLSFGICSIRDEQKSPAYHFRLILVRRQWAYECSVDGVQVVMTLKVSQLAFSP